MTCDPIPSIRVHAAMHAWLFVVALLSAFVLSTPVRAQTPDFTVTAPTMSAYVINGNANPTLNLLRGHTYTFNVNTPGHPFYIKTAQVTGTASTYDVGVTNNGATSGNLVFTVPTTVPTEIFYQCSVHSVMTAPIIIAAGPVPALPRPLVPALLLLLVCAGAIALRRRAIASLQ